MQQQQEAPDRRRIYLVSLRSRSRWLRVLSTDAAAIRRHYGSAECTHICECHNQELPIDYAIA